jgi:hypothetical protein
MAYQGGITVCQAWIWAISSNGRMRCKESRRQDKYTLHIILSFQQGLAAFQQGPQQSNQVLYHVTYFCIYIDRIDL